jgi:hypothetical protein
MADPLIIGFADEQTALLADHARGPVLRALTDGLAARAAHEQKQFKKRPMVCDDDATKDWRYKLGLIAGLEFAAGLPLSAIEKIERRIKG